MADRIFLNYRRSDSLASAGRLREHLAKQFGPDNVFKDVESTTPGTNYKEVIKTQLSRSGVFVAIIGDRWLDAKDDSGMLRLDDPEDMVRLEIMEALSMGIPVIPLLLDGVKCPTRENLHADIGALADQHGIDVRNDQHFDEDCNRLFDAISTLIAKGEEPENKAGELAKELQRPGKKNKVAQALYDKATATPIDFDAVLQLGDGYMRGNHGLPTDATLALKCYQFARRNGHKRAVRKVAEAYIWGPKAIRKIDEGLKLLRTCASVNNDPECHARLGQLFSEGTIVPVDPSAALKHLNEAAKENVPSALLNLAGIYEEGRLGQSVDLGKSMQYLEVADRAGNPGAKLKLGIFHYNGTGTPRSYALARARFEEAAKLGQLSAHQYLGRMHENGDGCEVDFGNARHHYQAAAQHGHSESMLRLARMLDRGRGGPMNPSTGADMLLRCLKGLQKVESSRIAEGGLTDWNSEFRIEVQKHLKKLNLYWTNPLRREPRPIG